MAKLILGVTGVRQITAALSENGYPDFAGYSLVSLTRRLEMAAGNFGIFDPGTLASKIGSDSLFANAFVDRLLIETTELFRDPSVWKFIRNSVLPDIFRKNDRADFWLPGCTSGDDLVSLYFLLKDDNLLERSSISVTSICEERLKNIRAGRFGSYKLKVSEENYEKVTGKTGLPDYLINDDGKLYWKKDIMAAADFLLEKSHLAAPSEPVDCVIFRDKMIYFNLTLCNRVIDTIYNNLHRGGYLVTGSGENLTHTLYAKSFRKADQIENVFRKNE